MATFLTICQETAREVGIAGTGPASVVGATGEEADVVRWVRDSYIDIQNRNGAHWRWLRHGFTVNTVASQDVYAFGACTDDETSALITRFSSWRFQDRQDPPKIFLTSTGLGGERWLIWSKWEWFKQIYKINLQTDGQPAHITIDPLDRIVIGPAPNDIYTVSGEYWLSGQVLALDADVPEMPIQFHNLVKYYAIEHYGYFESAPEVLARAEKFSKKYMRQLEANQLGRFRKARAIA